jgi:hypothetical protein
MGLRERLQAEAQARSEQLATRFRDDRCIACGTAGIAGLILAEFHWRKEVARSETHAIRVDHTSIHPMCPSCLAQVQSRRPWYWTLRYTGLVAFAAALCAIIAGIAVLWLMHLTNEERGQFRMLIAAGLVLLPLAVFISWLSRRYSVPASLVDMAGRGWECVGLREPADAGNSS